MTKIDKEIAEQLYDGKKHKRKESAYLKFVKSLKDKKDDEGNYLYRMPSGLLNLTKIAAEWKLHKKREGHTKRPLSARLNDLKIRLARKKAERLAKHLAKEHPSTKGKMTVLDPAPAGQKQSIVSEAQRAAMFAEIDRREARKKWRKVMHRGTKGGTKYRHFDIATIRRKLRSLRANRSKYLQHASKEQYRTEIRDLKRRAKVAMAKRHYDPDPAPKHHNWGKVVKHKRKAHFTKPYPDWSQVKAHWRRTFDPVSEKVHGISRPPKKWFYAMLEGIRKRSDVRNPAAIVGNIWRKLKPSKRLEIKRREATGEHFRYDLPLPEDATTKGSGTLRMVKPFNLVEAQVNLSLKDYISALKSGLFSKMKRQDGSTALVARCKSDNKNVNIFVDKL